MERFKEVSKTFLRLKEVREAVLQDVEEIRTAIPIAMKEMEGVGRWLYAGAIAQKVNEMLNRSDLNYYSIAQIGRELVKSGILASTFREHKSQQLLFFRVMMDLEKVTNKASFLLDIVKEAGGGRLGVRIPTLIEASRARGVRTNGHALSRELQSLVMNGKLELRTVKNGTATLKYFRLSSCGPTLDELFLESLSILKGDQRWVLAGEVAKDLLDRKRIQVNTVAAGIALSRLVKEGKLKKFRGRRRRAFSLPQNHTVPNPPINELILEALSFEKCEISAAQLSESIYQRSRQKVTPMTLGRFACRLAREGKIQVSRKGRFRTRYFRLNPTQTT